MQSKLKNHKGRFTSLLFREGKTTKCVCARVMKITEKTIQFKDINSGEVKVKMLASLVSE